MLEISSNNQVEAHQKQKRKIVLNPEDKLVTRNLIPIKTNRELSTFLGIKSKKLLTWFSNSKSDHYNIYKIPKKNGSFRLIHAPDERLIEIQYVILKRILEEVVIPDYIYAFELEKSVPEMAKKHVKKRIVISIDIKDFFHSIREDLVSTILQELRIEATPARTLTELCTYKYYVPQGAVTSPKISNMVIARTFGPELKRYCDEKGYVLTIYADDITISSKNEILRPYEVIQKVTDELNKYYFRVNKQKVKVMSTKTRQWVCGVVVNEKTNLWKQKRLKLRALIHNIVTNGIEPEARKNNLEPAAFIQSVRGMVNWFNQVNPVQGGKLVKKLNEYLSQHPITA